MDDVKQVVQDSRASCPSSLVLVASQTPGVSSTRGLEGRLVSFSVTAEGRICRPATDWQLAEISTCHS